ncbi:MAG: efflux RND transporter permease subunit [Endomicrobium sp.]|jgi:multidrug efflux pump subunit AcrB|nr:efflux RND transporter permease subunit [Endomicrobium sp.]
MNTINKYFTPLLKKVLNYSLSKIIFAVLIYVLVGIICFTLIPKAFMPKIDERRFVLNVTMPPDTPLEITNATSKRIERLIAGYNEYWIFQ